MATVSGCGNGDGFGDGNGSGYGRGDGDGYSCGRGDGSGCGCGCGNSNSNGFGFGFGFGYGRGNGNGDGYGYGFGLEKNQGITIRTKKEKTEMKYKGIELKEFTSEKPVLFDQPKPMLVWNGYDNKPFKESVVAFIPNRCCPVVGTNYTFEHCAEIPEESSELATVLQLAKWVATGNGLLKRGCCITNYFSFDEIDDTLLDCGLLKESVGRKTNYLMSNSFAFGGNNTSIIIGKVDE